MTIVLPHGVLFRGGEEGSIRQNLIENNKIDAIIGLPANIFFGTGIPTIIMVLKQSRDNDDILIIDASKGFTKEGKNNKLRACDIKKIADTVAKRNSITKYSKAVSRDEIRQNDYNLNIPRYVDSSENAETWDIYASMFGGIPVNEIDTLNSYWTAFPNLRSSLFKASDTPYVQLAVDDIKTAITSHTDISAFENGFNAAFNGFTDYLRTELIENAETVEISKEETAISKNIFARLENIPLVDKYEAYQLLDDNWGKISSDLEIIQTEGFEATKKVDPNIVLKKKNGVDVEVQEGYIGHIIPFELVQITLLKEDTALLKEKENRLAEISVQFEELLDSMNDEDKGSDAINEDGTAFVNAQVSKLAKLYLSECKKGISFADDSFEAKIITCDKLIADEKMLKKEIKEATDALHIKTKETIEALSDSDVKMLLEKKWIESLINSLYSLPDTIVDGLIGNVTALATKYQTTYFDIENEIRDTEKELCSLIDDLCGNEFDMKGLSEFKALLTGE